MREPDPNQAIRAAGGIGALARKTSIFKPSLSNWSRVPAERVLAVESMTGIDRAMLRPGLYWSAEAGAAHEVDAARAREYALLAALLWRAPDSDLLSRLAALRGNASALGLAHAALAEAARAANVERVAREFFDLFIGIGRGELVPYGSFYHTGFLNERPLAGLRDDLAQLGIERAEGEAEPEDHAAVLCEIMARLAAGSVGARHRADLELFDKHLAPWMGRFFADLEQVQASDFYRRVGAIGRILMEIETEAFALAS